ncbi:CRISPR-associated helicase/endonuclease Cas3 [Desulfosporosinus metallidurans]|uniref:CRISPR-associated protein Cas3 n=1 Tax=Desulfosporosinus metallidurans TaxID=1888891 RepID=A0A1Q8QMD8_9FIRM|nr:CRISPR-associated helicase/endonuclease Cas3 [Desulfosporosinus metallidurans]OLN28494.1 CRISPR-associated protein Cas3'' [Desulfosporosinus metallidurans]
MKYYAHSKTELSKTEWHLLKDHLEDTAKLTAGFASGFGAENLGRAAGLLHDIGKYSPDFQKRLEGERNKVDHSSAGAIEAVKHYNKAFGRILAYTIAGHHSGLHDWGSKIDESSLEGRLIKKSLPDYSPYQSEIDLPGSEDLVLPLKKLPFGTGFSGQFFTRFLYSSLVDADFLDTERALDVEKSSLRDKTFSLEKMLSTLEVHLTDKSRSSQDTPVNRRRAEILADCENKASNKPGFFTLSVPTGGGKTLSSMSFALKHAITHGMKRIIYVIPYTSIIEQNAAVFKDIFGKEKVLEHHSNFNYPEEAFLESESEYEPQGIGNLKLASENWDMPIIMTTNVQFFESLFAAKSSRCRKLHNITNSVVIIDEAQMIPTGFLKPCINALVELVANYNTTIVLCTATQPAINRLLPPDCEQPLEIVKDPDELYRAFQRVKVHNLGGLSDDMLAEKLLSLDQVLCIVNSKKHARLIFEKIKDKEAFHLSTRMCPAHRSQILQEIRKKLKAGAPCRVVSTQLIEAGVDVDFPVVYRSSAGVDSIAQSAGRCNREGLREIGDVYVFKPTEKHGLPSGWLSRTATIGEGVFRRHEDPLSLEGVRDYFTELYNIEGEGLDKERIMADISEQEKALIFPFRTIADKFKLIDDQNTTAIVIPWDEKCREILENTRWSKFPGSYIRRLQKYSVQVYEQEFREMLQIGLLENIGGKFYVLSGEAYNSEYSTKMGLLPCTESMLLKDTLII